MRGGRVPEMSAHSIQRCDSGSTEPSRPIANHSAESSGLKFGYSISSLGSPSLPTEVILGHSLGSLENRLRKGGQDLVSTTLVISSICSVLTH